MNNHLGSRVSKLPLGKVPLDVLEDILQYQGAESKDLVERPGVGVDFSAVKIGDGYLIISSDPVTGVIEDIGRYAVNVNANDVATSGTRPLFLQSILLLPNGTGKDLLKKIVEQIHGAAQNLGIAITGGHTEIIEGINRPIIMATCMATAKSFVSSRNAREGDVILMTKTAGIEGTSILSKMFSSRLSELEYGLLDNAKRNLDLLSVIPEAVTAFDTGLVNAMHDPTEGGLLGGLYEMAAASGLGFSIQGSNIPISPETKTVCSTLKVDPLKLISSGVLLISTSSDCKDQLLSAVEKKGTMITEIGRFTSDGCKVEFKDKCISIYTSPPDELWRMLSIVR